MKNYLLRSVIIGLFLFFSNSGQAQQISWFPDNAEWYYTVHCLSDPLCGHLYYYTDGDTVIDGAPAIIIRSQQDNSEAQNSQTATHYFRVANDTVFYFSNSTNAWGMLYDFNAQPGDVWDLTETLSGIIFPVWDEEAEARIEVDSITNEMLGDVMRRVIHTSPLYNEEEMEPQSDWTFYGSIVEGIGPVGSSHGLFGESVAQPLGGWLPVFSCYREGDQLVYGSGELPCGIVSSVDHEEVSPISIFPNPTTSHIRLQLPPDFAFRAAVTVYNITGQMVGRNENFNSLDPLPMNYPPGLYVVEARSNGQVVRGKVVVE